MANSFSTSRRFGLPIAILVLFAGSLVVGQSALLIAVRHDPSRAVAVSQASQSLDSFLWTAVLLHRMLHSIHLKEHWLLFAASWAIDSIGNLFDLISSYAFHQVPSLYVSSGRDVIHLAAFIPLFSLTTLPSARRHFSSLVWLNIMQAMFIVCGLYTLIFHALPFEPRHEAGSSANFIVHVYEIMEAWSTFFLLLRYLASAHFDERHFYRFAFMFMAVSNAAIAINNEVSLRFPDQVATNVLCYVANFAIVVWCLHMLPNEKATLQPTRASGVLVDYINIGGPVISSAGLATLGMVLLPQRLGLVCMIAAFVLLAARSTVYIRRFEKAQASLESARAQLETLSYTDELTGVANRRACDQSLDAGWQRGLRSNSPLSVILIDIDYFKQLNDQLGHQSGDACLAAVSRALRAALPRSIDMLGRYGGDEFCAILPGIDAASAEKVADRLCSAVKALHIEHPASGTGIVTISLGIGTGSPFAGGSVALLLKTADDALYEAKASGRNGWRCRSLSAPEEA